MSPNRAYPSSAYHQPPPQQQQQQQRQQERLWLLDDGQQVVAQLQQRPCLHSRQPNILSTKWETVPQIPVRYFIKIWIDALPL